jgi:hypothetical protein
VGCYGRKRASYESRKITGNVPEKQVSVPKVKIPGLQCGRGFLRCKLKKLVCAAVEGICDSNTHMREAKRTYETASLMLINGEAAIKERELIEGQLGSTRRRIIWFGMVYVVHHHKINLTVIGPNCHIDSRVR